ncbi:MAG: Kae1-associated serine/threonine protein kinase [Candidatus Heimdallarchaeota archaeon]|nr:MAG: Kae1-associated serine/threonine protein kinase [Candidatus Heimdallarchaeota archaeon]
MMIVQGDFLVKGAEASIYTGFFLQSSVIIKQRLPKTYRMQQLDQTIRLQRLRAEARIMTSAWKIGIQVPVLLGINIDDQSLLIEEIPGELLFTVMSSTTRIALETIFESVGQQVGLLHENDLIHGDLTVFNIIIGENNTPWLIDFGLGQVSVEMERKADDLLTFYNTLKAISSDFQVLFEAFQVGYNKEYSKGRKTIEHTKKIQSRARYILPEERLE